MKPLFLTILFSASALLAQPADTVTPSAADTLVSDTFATEAAESPTAVEEAAKPAAPTAEKTKLGVLKECPEDMEYVISRQKRKVREFCIDRYEYPNMKGETPMANVTWYTAKKICEKKGKRLCMDWEWEHACAGLNKWDYAYHNVYDESKCNDKGEELAKSGDYTDCQTKNYMLWDMVGNLQEWTAGGGVGAAGGTYKDGKSARCSKWDALSLKDKNEKTGFRCCVKVDTGRFGKVKNIPTTTPTSPVQ